MCNDKHLRILFGYKPRPDTSNKEPTRQELAEMKQFARRMNHGFEKVERLEGNVGYVDLRGFFPADEAGETVASAMSFLANSDALIIDLRKNHGGSPVTVALVSSYLFDSTPVHLNDLYFRPQNETRQFWTLAYVPGKRFPKKPVYVLTSKETFSGGEEFASNLKVLKRPRSSAKPRVSARTQAGSGASTTTSESGCPPDVPSTPSQRPTGKA